MTEVTEIELMAYTYLACCWVSFGSYAMSTDVWTWRECFGRTMAGANSGMVMGLLSFQVIGLTRPWQFVGIACSTAMGWTRKEDIQAMIKRILGGNGKNSESK